MTTLRVHAESGLEVRRDGPPGRGAAVVVVTEPGTSGPTAASALDGLRTAVHAAGASLYQVVWTPTGAELAGVGRGHLARVVLPRALRRVARDASLFATGPLHVVALGEGGVLVAGALSHADAELPVGGVVLCGAVTDPDRAPVPRRSRVLWRDRRLEGLSVPRAAVRLGADVLAGPSGWRRTIEAVVSEGALPQVERGDVSGAWLADTAGPVHLGGRVDRPLLVLASDADAQRPTAACFGIRRRWAGPVRTLAVPGRAAPLRLLSHTHHIVVRHLNGARA